MKQGEVWWAEINPTIGNEIQGKGLKGMRPVLVIQPDVFNNNPSFGTVMVVPITSTLKNYPWRVATRETTKKPSAIVCEQIRTLDKSRLTHKMCSVTPDELEAVLKIMRSFFSNK
ncbi:MAG: growth inhibitor PemK [Pseudomonas sp.]|nr:growth inhibitor PemK [Pseudomonas sp.]|tara:strand:+ start:1019 stop:1363 length:345 start_codon:yes stop_codon:yes gene_type:complete